MSELLAAAIGAVGLGSILADQVSFNRDLAVIGIVAAVVAFLAACLWRAMKCGSDHDVRKI